ncbi:hypothetical protein FNL55_18950 [Tardiphaga sp. vice352]|uniref:hypothetical protein n=1 Tax=unclassified Tardiphaga TaxID=2631404 RepID=UPI0011648C21|nr:MULTISPECIES: hypothetical protein [unclassified Tardiphaga]QDM17844.1 hypothetical protein FNL53_19235 [Tardiphaga sp. vice278]QDM22904.1 hypothetical protein FIU28_18380 [Tardiphaga sp. vice154]QDM33205.1 hypothetical protein FNL55_18950 [Tardiphaga sp. vice352]
MAEEAFALSPISARPNVPGEADYDAIREAFMETARGRWFLNEYAKRNRHADTGMVLEAVARIEAGLKAQKQTPAGLSLSQALGSIRSALRQAKATAIESLPRHDIDDTLTAARNGARIVREIAWTLRECGADVRICDLLDTQVTAIEAGQPNAGDDGREAVLASYDVLMQTIEQLADGRTTAAGAEADTPPAAEMPTPEEARASVTPLFKAPAPDLVAEAAELPESVVEQAAMPEPAVERMIAPAVEMAPAAIAPIAESTAELAVSIAETSRAELAGESAVAEAETALETALEADAYDLAVLDRVAMEMAVQDPSEPETSELDTLEPEMDAPEIDELQIDEPEIAPPTAVAARLPAVMPTPIPAIVSLAPAPEPIPEPAPQPKPQAEPAYHPSLGAALIASGVISNPNAPAADPLAAIRRMSQSEKIAFFS